MIPTVTLPSGKVTTRIGFGCAALNGGGDRKASQRLVEAALSAGIRHFDTAPSYGGGMSEEILGEVLHTGGVATTIATKVGIGRPAGRRGLAMVRSLVKPLMRLAPQGMRKAARAVKTATQASGVFQAAKVRDELTRSLALLKSNRVDLYLMHEMRPADSSPDLIAALGAIKEQGLIGDFGLATTVGDAVQIARDFAALGAVWQSTWCVLDDPLPAPATSFVVTHGAVRRAYDRVWASFADDKATACELSHKLDYDVCDPEGLAVLLLAAAINANPNGIVLVSTSRADRITRFADAAASPDLPRLGADFHRAWKTTFGSQSAAGNGRRAALQA